MSRAVDERVVSMEFDNRQFESGVQTTLGTLDKLKKGLNLTGAAKGLENIDSAADKIDMSGISSGVETLKLKFSALQVMAVTALTNITNSAINAGKRIASALTIDPIKSGFQEYETQINAVQTILANTKSKGTTLDDVNSALDELNKYADQTIYNFTEMTRNIGTFTAAGVDLDKSVTSIKGIANLAAVSGSNAQQASTAMYQLSQALAAGKVSLMDWNSVVNAGMGGQLFQDALKRTATNMGYNVDALIEKYGSFRESLTQGNWLTAEVLTETLTQLSGAYTKADLIAQGYSEKQAEEIVDLANTAVSAATEVKTFTGLIDTLKEALQSGWTQTWELIVGDFEEAKSLFTGISDTLGGLVNKSAESRNHMLTVWKAVGGRQALLDAFKNSFEALGKIITPISEAFREIFPPMTADRLIELTKGFKSFTEKLIISDTTAQNLKSTFKGLFSVIDIIVTALSSIAKGAVSLLGNLTGLGDGVLGVTGSFGDWLSSLRDTIKQTDIFGKAIDGIVGFVQKAIDVIKEFASAISIRFVSPGFEGFLGIIEGIWNVVKLVGGKIAEIASSIGNALANAFDSGNISSFMDILNGGIFAAILLNIKKFTGGLGDSLGELGGIKGLAESITDIFGTLKDSLESFQQNLQAGTLLKIAGAIGILAASIVVISLVDPDKLAASLGTITVLFADLLGSMFLFNKIGGEYQNTMKAVTAMIGISTAVLILASALKMVSSLDPGELVSGILGIMALTATIVAAVKLLSTDTGKAMSGAMGLVVFASAIKILASACKDLSDLTWEEMAKGLLGVGALMAAVAIFLKTAKFGGKAISTATGIVVLSAAIKILASACRDFKDMSWEDIAKGLSSIGALLAEIIIFTKLTGNAKNIMSTGIAMIAIGAAIRIFSTSVKDLSELTLEEISRGLLAMAGALAAITISVRLMPKNMVSMGTGLVVVASAMLILANAVGKMGGMSWDKIGKGLTVFGSSLAILAVGLFAMKNSISGAGALLIAAGALAILTPVLMGLGHMSWESIVKGLVALAGAFTVIGVAGLLLGPLVPALLGIAGSITLLGLGCLAAGAGILAFATGLTALAAAGTAGAAALVAAIGIIITGIAALIPAIIDSLIDIVEAICKVIAESAPQVAVSILTLVVELLKALATYTPQIVEYLMLFLIGLLEGIAKRLPELVAAAIKVIVAFFQGVADALSSIDTGGLLKGIIGVGLLSALMLALSAVAGLIPGAMVGVLGMGVVIAELAGVLAILGGLAQIPGLMWLIEEGGQFLEAVGTAIGQFIGGIAGGLISGVSSSFPKIGSDLAAFMQNVQPFIEGAKLIDSSVMEGVKSLAEVILILTAADILDGLTSWLTGGSSLSDFGAELAAFGPYMARYAASVAGIDATAVEASANAAKALSEMASNLPNSGGLVGWFTGENDISDFGDQLEVFGRSMKIYSNSVAGIDANAVTNSATAAKALAELAKNLPNSGGVVSWFTGDNNISSFGDELVLFGNGIKAYADSVSGMDSDAITNSATAAKALSALANDLPNSGGLVSLFSGDNDISSFGQKLIPLGQGLKTYSDSVVGIDPEATTNSIGLIRKLISLFEGMAGVDVSGVTSFSTALSTLTGLDINTFITSFSMAIPQFTSIGVNIVNAIVTGITSRQAYLTQNINKLVTSVTKAFDSKKTTFNKIGVTIVTEMVNGMNNTRVKAVTAMNLLLTTLINAVKSYYGGFYEAGGYLVGGFAQGITDNTFIAEARARAMALAALAAAKQALGVASPSKEFYKIGRFSGEGFINALTDYGTKVYNAGYDMAGEAKSGLSDAIRKVANVIDSGIDTQPTIRPVLDLSDITSGAGAISSMLDMTPSIRALGNIGTVSPINQNGAESEIVSAIDKLRKDLGSVGNTTYQVNGITYDDGSNISDAVKSLVRAARVERRI